MSGYHLKMKRGALDPRTKGALLVLTAVFCLGGAGGARLAPFRMCLSFFPFALSFLSGRRRAAGIRIALLAAGTVYLNFLYTGSECGALSAFLLFTASVFTRLLPCLEMGEYAASTTTVSEFTAAMHRMHAPDALTVPMSVMFRMFPAIRENAGAIHEAMTMRGVILRNPGKFLEYWLVPLVECTARIGDDLSASALLRGLGAPGRRTEICTIGPRLQDFAVWTILAVFLGVSIWITG